MQTGRAWGQRFKREIDYRTGAHRIGRQIDTSIRNAAHIACNRKPGVNSVPPNDDMNEPSVVAVALIE